MEAMPKQVIYMKAFFMKAISMTAPFLKDISMKAISMKVISTTFLFMKAISTKAISMNLQLDIILPRHAHGFGYCLTTPAD